MFGFQVSNMTEKDPEELFNQLVTLMGVMTGLFFSVCILHTSSQGIQIIKSHKPWLPGFLVIDTDIYGL